MKLGPLAEQWRSARREDLMRDCPQLFTYKEEQWQNLQVPDVLQNNLLGAFLAKAGPRNSRQISNVEFYADDCDAVGEQMPIATELVRLYMPGLREVQVHVFGKEVFDDESPDYYHPDRSSPFWMNGLFKPMYDALVDFVNKVPWLRVFKYSGQGDFGSVNEGPVTGLHQLKQLEQKVRDRSNADTMNDDLDEKPSSRI